MKLPVAWLKQYLDVKLPAAKLAERLTLSGTKVEDVRDPQGEAVIDIEVTSNRPDCLSILGLAREVSAVLGGHVRVPKAYLSPEKPARPRSNAALTVHIEDKKGCPRYTGRVLRNVQVRPSPSEAQRLLAAMGSRPISNAVDVTNFVLFECGQPMHAFDLDKIRGERVVVRRSRNGEKFLGIDGIEYALDDNTLVIADGERVVAIAGVMGGKLTEVTEGTKNILLESAYFDPALVRQASKKYRLTTESSYRFERGVNPELVGRASARAAGLMREWAGAEDVSGLLDKDFSQKKTLRPIRLRLSRLQEALGLPVKASRAAAILKKLSFPVRSKGGDTLEVKPILSRRDVTEEVDLHEEVLRIEGFEKVGLRLPATRYSFEPLVDRKALGLMELKRYLAGEGFDEIRSYSLLSAKKLADTMIPESDCHRVINASSAEQGFFRPRLLPGMLEAVLFNVHRKASSLRFFEIGNRYRGGREETVLALALYGPLDENWVKKHPSSFYDLKGMVENVMDHLKVRPAQWAPEVSDTAIACGADLVVDGRSAGSAGEVSPAILRRWDIPHELFYAELDLEGLFDREAERLKVRPVAKFPLVRRDIAFIIDNRVSVKDLEMAMHNAASPYLHAVTLFDQFTGKNVPEGKRSLAFSLSYQKEGGTFTDEEIQSLQKRLGENLKRLYQVEFR